ncbi:hypothetical protein BDR03DRAFT_222837 [Suillus americanus]|nr:hypothetical protein BDR03DRAFT_222837 [Suillus americanus]
MQELRVKRKIERSMIVYRTLNSPSYFWNYTRTFRAKEVQKSTQRISVTQCNKLGATSVELSTKISLRQISVYVELGAKKFGAMIQTRTRNERKNIRQSVSEFHTKFSLFLSSAQGEQGAVGPASSSLGMVVRVTGSDLVTKLGVIGTRGESTPSRYCRTGLRNVIFLAVTH